MKYSLANMLLLCSLGFISSCSDRSLDQSGRHILDFIDEEKINVLFNNASITNIGLTIENKCWYPIKIHIPRGTVLLTGDNNYQDMLCYMDQTIEIGSQRTKSDIMIPVVCMNLPKKIPQTGMAFIFQRQTQNIELNEFISFLSHLDKDSLYTMTGLYAISYGIMQAAVWIITDNADDYDLQKLVTSNQYNRNSFYKTLTLWDKANAINVLYKSEIDLQSKRIRFDIDNIYTEMVDYKTKLVKYNLQGNEEHVNTINTLRYYVESN
jgi:hypothetical protein